MFTLYLVLRWFDAAVHAEISRCRDSVLSVQRISWIAVETERKAFT